MMAVVPRGLRLHLAGPRSQGLGRGHLLKTRVSPWDSSGENECFPGAWGSSGWAAMALAPWDVAQRGGRFWVGFGGH